MQRAPEDASADSVAAAGLESGPAEDERIAVGDDRESPHSACGKEGPLKKRGSNALERWGKGAGNALRRTRTSWRAAARDRRWLGRLARARRLSPPCAAAERSRTRTLAQVQVIMPVLSPTGYLYYIALR